MLKRWISAFLISLLAYAPVNARMVQMPSQGFMMPALYPNGPLIEDYLGNLGAMSGATQKIAFIGRVYANDLNFRKGLTAKKIQHISFGAETVTCAGCTSIVQVDVEGVSLSAGPPQQPDGVIAGGGSALATKPMSTITQNAWQSAFPNLRASVSVHYGDLIAIVWSFSSYDSGTFKLRGSGTLADNAGLGPQISTYNGSAWRSPGTTGPPNLVLDFDDGTIGTFAMSMPFNAGKTDFINAASATPEIGMSFQLPFDAQVDQICAAANVVDGGTTAVIELTDNNPVPHALASVALDGHAWRQAAGTQSISCFPIPIQNIKRNTKYVVGLRVTSASPHNLTVPSLQVASANHWGLNQGSGPQFGYVTRSAGAWSAPTATLRPFMAVVVSAVDDGTGGGTGP